MNLQRVLTLGIALGLGWYAYVKYHATSPSPLESAPALQSAAESPRQVENEAFRCDGRTYCSQMTSCEEATYFIEHCPNTKMDGNNDGVPCERQWCK